MSSKPLTILVLLVLSLSAPGAGAESLRIEPKHARFDVATASSTVRQTYTIVNTGTKPVVIREWKAISDHGEVKGLPASLAPGQNATFEVELPLPGSLGHVLHRFAIFTDEDNVERYRFTLGGFVHSLVSPAPAVFDLGSPRFDSTQSQSIELDARESTPFALEGIVSAPDWLDVRIDGHKLHARLKPDGKLGIHVGNVRVKTNIAAQPFVDVATRAVVTGTLIPSTYALGLRPVHVGEKAQAEINVTYTGNGRLADLVVHAPAGWLTARSACPEQAPGKASACTRVTLSMPVKESGMGSDLIRFEMPGEPVLEVPLGTIALGAEQTVRELVLAEQGEAPPPKLDIAATLAAQTQTQQPATQPAAEDTPQTGKNVAHSEGKGPVRLRWRAANDGKVFGYMIYRATDRAGPFQRVSTTPVRNLRGDNGIPGEARRADYEFVDDSVKPGQAYYYYIDAIASNGAQSRFSPVMSKKVIKP